MSKLIIVLVTMASLGNPALPQSTSGWQTLTDSRTHGQFCQGKSPQGWDTFRSPVPAPIGIARVVPQVDTFGDIKNYTFDNVKSLARGTTKVLQAFEDSPTRFWVAFDGKTGVMYPSEALYRVHWYVVVPSNPVCGMYIFFDDPALTEQAKLIAQSLRGAK